MKVSNSKKPILKERTLFIICCCALPVIQWIIFYVFANGSSFVMAFTDKTGAFSFENFARLGRELKYMDSNLSIAIRNTFLTFAIILVSYPFKVLVSFFIYKKVPGAGIYRILFFLPTIIFSVAMTLIVQKLLGVNGFIAKAVGNVQGLDYVPSLLSDSRYANAVVLLHMMWMQFAGNLIIWGGTFARIPVEVLESARIDGVNWWQEFIKITVPLVWPTVALQMVLMVCGVFSASGEVFLLTGGEYGTMTLNVWMYKQIYEVAGNINTSNVFNYMSAVGLVMTVIAVTISLSVRKWTDKAFSDVDF